MSSVILLLPVEGNQRLFRSAVDERLFDDDNEWNLWLSDQIWSQTSFELNRGGFRNHGWPRWAFHMIASMREEGHVQITAPRAAQLAALLANDNRRHLGGQVSVL